MRAEDLILVSVDDHIAEPRDMFEAHVPARYRDQMPRVVVEVSGVEQWYYGEIRGRNLGLNAVAGKPREYWNIDASRYDEMRPGCYDVHERIRDMNAGGVLASLNFPNWTGFAGQVLNQGPDRTVNEVMIRAYNDWHVDEWSGAYPGRFIPCGILPLFDAGKAAAEVRRLAAKGCHAVTFSENPEALNMPSIHSGYWDPLFAACVDEGTVLCCHLGSSSKSPMTSTDAPPSVTFTISCASTVNTLVDLMWSDIFHRFPDLKFALTEGDTGWIPYFLWRAEQVYSEHSGWTKHAFPPGISGPSDIFRRNILCCFVSDPIGLELLHHFNIDNLSWESDYPHCDGAWPTGPERVATLMADLPEEVVAKLTHENAMRNYQFDPFTHRLKERCTAGALRAESPDVDVVTHLGRPADERDLASWRAMTSKNRELRASN